MNFFKTYFTDTQVTLLIIAFCLLLLSGILHSLKKDKLSVLLLVLSGTACFSFGALLDPFLNAWDERFHALVAKNMMGDMLKPMLFANPILDIGWSNWTTDSIWLHKQPLFLWQIAICFKIFGVSEFTVRLPDVILGSIMVFTNYRCGKLLANRDVGFITGAFTVFSFYFIELISGRQMTDHNDFIFLCYVSFSIWSFIEYKCSEKKYWILLIGFFAGCAVLNKWLLGLFVYLIWGAHNLLLKNYNIKSYLPLLKSLVVTLFVFLPWQFFIFDKYPEIAEREFAYNSKHVTDVVEGHKGTVWYHLEQFIEIYGLVPAFLVVIGLYFLYKSSSKKKLLLSCFSSVGLVYLFFSWVVATKMPSFTVMLSTFIIIAIAQAFSLILNKLKKYKSVFFPILITIICIIKLDVETLQLKHTLWKKENTYSSWLMSNKKYYLKLNLPENAVLFNLKEFHVDAMFYTGKTAYWFLPSEDQCVALKAQNKSIVILNSSITDLPEHIKGDNEIIKL